MIRKLKILLIIVKKSGEYCTNVTLTEQIKCVRRELDYRRRLYPKWVADGKMTQNEANYEIEAMEYVLNTIQAVLNFERDFIAKNQNLFK